jgi:hypothetical protein
VLCLLSKTFCTKWWIIVKFNTNVIL